MTFLGPFCHTIQKRSEYSHPRQLSKLNDTLISAGCFTETSDWHLELYVWFQLLLSRDHYYHYCYSWCAQHLLQSLVLRYAWSYISTSYTISITTRQQHTIGIMIMNNITIIIIIDVYSALLTYKNLTHFFILPHGWRVAWKYNIIYMRFHEGLYP